MKGSLTASKFLSLRCSSSVTRTNSPSIRKSKFTREIEPSEQIIKTSKYSGGDPCYVMEVYRLGLLYNETQFLHRAITYLLISSTIQQL